MFKQLRAVLMLARSLRRIADALDEQNRIRKIELQELHGVSIPDPNRKFSKKELETEISYESVPVGMEAEEEAETWDDVFKDR
jgi:hypothetical protein